MDYDFEKLARAVTADRLKTLSNVEDAAAEVAAKIIGAAVQSTRERQDPRVTISAVCRGVIGGLVLVERDPSGPAAALLGKMAQLAHELHLDPQETMTWAMEGIAEVAAVSSSDTRHAIREAIDEKFMGAGEVFGSLCDAAAKKQP